jgi:hypothetical protein
MINDDENCFPKVLEMRVGWRTYQYDCFKLYDQATFAVKFNFRIRPLEDMDMIDVVPRITIGVEVLQDNPLTNEKIFSSAVKSGVLILVFGRRNATIINAIENLVP